jgi:ABC-type transport system substrate-binding protein
LLLSSLDLAITKQIAGGQTAGVGPFSQESDSSVLTVLRANPYYHDGAPQISAIHLRSYSSVRAAWSATMRGESDVLYRVPNDAREFLERDNDVTTFPVLRSNVFSLVFNSKRQVFESTTVRRALSMAVDRQEIIDLAMRRLGQPATGFIWPSHWAMSPDAPSFAYQPMEAFRLLFPPAPNGPAMRVSDLPRDRRIRFSALVPAGQAPTDRIAIVLQKQLFDVGVDMAIEPVPVGELIGRLDSGDYDSAILDLNSGTTLALLYSYWHSGSPGFGDLGYDAADEALDALRAASTDDEVRLALRRVQDVFHQDPPAIFLGWPETTRAVNRRFIIPESDLSLLTSVARWRPATRSDGEP